MKNYIFTNLIFIFSFSDAQYTSIPDTNFENYLETNGMGDGIANNGLVLTANIVNIVELDVSSRQISDLTGIEDFSSLEILGCAHNNLSHLDVSHNSNLRILLCTANSLTSIILNNPELVEFLAYENYLTSVNLSTSPLLEHLELQLNELVALDVSNNPELKYLWCDDNHLTELDISYNTLLEIVACAKNQIESLSAVNNPHLVWFAASQMSTLNFLDLRNGNNALIQVFDSTGTDSLQCIYVDNATDAYNNEGWYKDNFSYYVNNELECSALDISELGNELTYIYPNPVTENLKIVDLSNKITRITVVDTAGRTIFNSTFHDKKVSLDWSYYPKGVYFITVQFNNKIPAKQKIIKK